MQGKQPSRIRFIAGAVVTTMGAAALLMAWQLRTGEPKIEGGRAADPEQAAFLIRFGVNHPGGRTWDGSVQAEGGRVLSLEGWQFAAGDSITSDRSWKCATREENYWYSPWERSLQPTKNLRKITAKGLLLRTTTSGRITIATPQGEFRFSPAEVTWSNPKEFASGDAIISRSPDPKQLAQSQPDEDFPALCETRDGTLWLAYQSYDGHGDQLWVQHGWNSKPEPLTAPGARLFRAALAEDRDGGLWAVWAAEADGDWDLYARRFDGRKWSTAERLTRAAGPDILHSLASDSQGRIYLVWQSFRDGQSHIYLRVYDGRRWGPALPVSSGPANDWEPAVAAGPKGQAAIVWDTYSRGNYDVMLRWYQDATLSPAVTIAGTPMLEARPAAMYDSRGRLWLAWEEGDADWGKDYVLGILNAGMGLLMRRQVRVACYEGGQLRQLPGDLTLSLPVEERTAFQKPALAIDGAGNPWVFFRFRTNTPVSKEAYGVRVNRFRTIWRLGAASFQNGAWTRAIEFPGGYGRMDAPYAVVRRRDGSLQLVWNSDGRTLHNAAPGQQRLYAATLGPGPWATPLDLQPTSVPNVTAAPPHPNEPADVARLRAYRAEVDGKTYRPVRGDMHRHTDLSWDGNRDGSLFDAYRYALDAAAFEYLGVADHQAGETQYSWWLSQKAVTLFTVPGCFAPLYGYERSLEYPNGHRNAMFADAGIPVFPIPEAERLGKEGAGRFYQYLHANRGISMPHTSATGAGTDWRDNDPEVEPLVEIYQGYRNNYEHEGAPRASKRRERPEGFVWNAWKKGYRLGVQSSSDHVSTHGSYAILYATEVSRAAILEAIRARRAYAATDNILLDFRVNGHMMGEAFRSAETPLLTAYIAGTAPIRKVAVIRNNTYIHTGTPSAEGATSFRFSYLDNQPLSGGSYYYIRVEQTDGQLAWSSPIWIERQP
jgi:hypothetical protein